MSKMTKTVAALGVVAGLGVAMLPVGAFAAPADTGAVYTGPATQNVTFQAAVDDYIQITVAEAQVVAATPATTAQNATGSTGLTIKSNSTKGYTATIAANTGEVRNESGTITTNGTADMIGTNANNKIPGGKAVTPGTSAWGYKIGSLTDMVPAATTASTFAEKTTAADADGDSYTLECAASVEALQAADNYSGQDVIHATAK